MNIAVPQNENEPTTIIILGESRQRFAGGANIVMLFSVSRIKNVHAWRNCPTVFEENIRPYHLW